MKTANATEVPIVNYGCNDIDEIKCEVCNLLYGIKSELFDIELDYLSDINRNVDDIKRKQELMWQKLIDIHFIVGYELD